MPDRPISDDPVHLAHDPLGDRLASLADSGGSSGLPPAPTVIGRARRRHRRHVAAAVAVPVVAAAVAVGAVTLPAHHQRTEVAVGASRSAPDRSAGGPFHRAPGPGSKMSAPSGLGPDLFHATAPTIPASKVHVDPRANGAICHLVVDPASMTRHRSATLPIDPASVDAVWMPEGLAVPDCRTTTATAGAAEARLLVHRIAVAPPLPAVNARLLPLPNGCPVTAGGSVSLAFNSAGTSQPSVVTVTLGPCGRITLPGGQVRQIGDVLSAVDALHPPAWVPRATTTPVAG